jgi:hypothetical protein
MRNRQAVKRAVREARRRRLRAVTVQEVGIAPLCGKGLPCAKCGRPIEGGFICLQWCADCLASSPS